MTWIQWLILAGLFFIGEIVTPGFILLWFGVGAVISSLLALLHVSLFIQVIVFILSSTVFMVFTRPIVKKMIKQNDVPSNVYAMSGKKGIVVQEINNLLGQGQVKVSGEVWQARSEDEEIISVESEVEVLRVEGVKVIVFEPSKKKLNEEVLK